MTRSIKHIPQHPLLLYIYYGVRTVFSTADCDAMGTTRPLDYDTGRLLIERFRLGEVKIQVEGREIRFTDLDEQTRSRFSVEYIKSAEDAYHDAILQGDARDRARRSPKGKS